MRARWNIDQARTFAEQHGCNVLEQRGFYSHFMRIREGFETINTLDIRRGHVSRRAVVRAILDRKGA